jgi:hypothetical protein
MNEKINQLYQASIEQKASLLARYFNDDGTPKGDVERVWINQETHNEPTGAKGVKVTVKIKHIVQKIGELIPEGVDSSWVGYGKKAGTND